MAARIFLISDTHFGHDRIYTFTTQTGSRVRPMWDKAELADQEMILRWNSVVTVQDHVYHLGDVGWGANLAGIVASLNGHKRLVLGNHDRDDVRAYREMGFQKVMGCHQFQRGIWFTHIPMHPDSMFSEKAVNIHGHIHEKPPYSTKYRNVSVERINYTPMLLDEVLDGR